MGRKWRVLTALLLGFALVAGACGSDDEEAAPAATTAAPAATTAAPAATTAAPAAADSADPIKLPIHNWSSQIAGVYAVGAILESTGNSVEYISADSTLVYTSMCEGDMDLVHEVWQGAFGVAFEEQVDKGCVIDAATHDAKTREEWWYPSYVEDVCPGLPDWEALNSCAELFATPDSGGKGRFLGGPVDWLKGDQERVEGLEMDFIVENAGTAGALWSALEAASANNEPIVLFNWTPNFIEAMYDGAFIEFPTFADECRTDASWGINPETTHDCGNPKDGYLKLGVWEGFPAKWPNAYAAVQKMNLTNLDVAQLAMYVDIDGMEPEDAAALWLADNCARWTGWSGADASVCPAAPEGPAGIRIAVVAPSASNDLAFSQSIVDGVNALSGVDEISITDGTFIVDDAAAAVRDYAEDGYDLVIAHGSQYGGFLSEMAPDFPDTAFAWGTSGDTFGLDNVSAYTASSDQGGYVMGAMAAAMTTSRTIGVIGPIEVGDAKLYVDGFVAGAAAQDQGVSVNVNYIMSFSDVALAAEAAQAHIANRADILTGTAQMVVGATGVAAEHGAKWFGTQSNQTALGEDMVVASQVYKWEVVLQGIVDGIAAGDLGGEAHDINLGNGGLVIEFNDGVDAGDARAVADAAIAAIIAGGVDTTYVAPQPTRGGTLVQASTQVGNSINHGLASGVGIGNPSSKIFASLVHLDPNWQPQPYLAESWEVSEDGLTVTLHLVEGATFHDGVPITSADVKFSIEAIQANHPFTGMWAPLESIDTPDDLTVVLNLATEHPALWIAMSDVLMPVMPKHIMGDTPLSEMKGHPNNTAALEGDLITVGSGPFVLTEWNKESKIVLEAYEDFFIPDRPYLDSIIYVIVPDEDAALLGLESGEYDTAGYASVLNEQKVLNNPDVVAIPYAGGVGALNHLQFNMANDVMSDLRVRQAIAYTIDRDYVINTLHQGMTTELLGGIYPDSPFYNPNVERYDVDLDKARALLAEAGYADGLELRIHYIPGPNEQQRNVAEYIAQALEEVGVDVEVVNSADAGAWVGIFFGGPDAWQMTMTAYFNWGDPVIGVQRAYVCDNIKVSFFVNNSAYCNERVDELLYAAAAEPDFDARKALYDEFQEITAIELPFYNINALPIFGARQPDVMNLPTGPWGNLSGMENVWLDR